MKRSFYPDPTPYARKPNWQEATSGKVGLESDDADGSHVEVARR